MDTELHVLDGIFVSDDTMEGLQLTLRSFRRFPTKGIAEQAPPA